MTFPFFVGCQRSGTTLFRAIFDSHPELAIPGESHFVVSMLRKGPEYQDAHRFRSELFIHDLLAHDRFRKWGLPESVVRDAVGAAQPSDLPEAIRCIYRLYASQAGKTRYADKTPDYALHIPLLAACFPEARFINIVRDGRDVALALLEMGSLASTVKEAAIHWAKYVRQARRAGANLGSLRYREVRYEDLLDRPEVVVAQICGFLELDPDPQMLGYFSRAGTIISQAHDPSLHTHLLLPLTKGLRDWRRGMSQSDLETFEIVAGRQLAAESYELATRPSLVRFRWLMINASLWIRKSRGSAQSALKWGWRRVWRALPPPARLPLRMALKSPQARKERTGRRSDPKESVRPIGRRG